MRTLLALALLALPASASTHVDLTPACVQILHYGAVECSVAWHGEDDEVWLRNHTTVRFDLGAQIPAGATVSAVSLSLHAQTFFDAGPFAIRELTAPVACPGGVWSGPGLGLGAPAGPVLFLSTAFDPLTPSFSSAAFKQIVQGWVDAPALNNGLLFAALGYDNKCCLSSFVLHVDFDDPCPPPVSFCIAAPNSQGPNGAHFSITGSTSLAANDMAVVATGVRPGAPGFFYFGANQQQIPYGNGYSCAGTPLLRLAAPNLFADATGKLVRPVNFTVGSASHIQIGETWHFQCLYRDVPGGGAHFNLTDGLSITFCP